MDINCKLFYKSSYKYLLDMLPNEITNEQLEKYFIGVYNHPKDLKDVYIGLIRTAQNYQFMPNVIAFDKRKEKIERILHGFDHEYIASLDIESLYKEFRKTFNVTSGDSHYNSWYRWSCSVVDSAKYVCRFRNVEEFDTYVRSKKDLLRIPLEISGEIRGIGFALACDFLKETGYPEYIKPDVHIIDICEALEISDRNQINVFRTLIDIANRCGVTPYKLDKILWLICSGNFYLNGVKINGNKKEFITFLKERLSAENNTVKKNVDNLINVREKRCLMNKKDMIDLIKVAEAVERMRMRLTEFIGGGEIDNPDLETMSQVYEVIKRNSIYPGEGDYDVDMFDAIINAINKTPEEKYVLLTGDKSKGGEEY